MLMMLLPEEGNSEGDADSGVCTDGSMEPVPLVSLEPTEPKALLVKPLDRSDHLLVGFSALLAGL